jgi:DNA-directed RNA polymerase specialized sigma24 family protein
MGRRKELIDASPENEAKARAFMSWYGVNMDKLRYYVQGSGLAYDEDMFTDAFLRAYDAIARRGTLVKDNTGYFLQTYRATFLDSKKTPIADKVDERVAEGLSAPDFDSDTYEDAVETINAEVLEYVRENYDEVAVSLFEIYVGLSPDISYKRMSNMLGIPATKIWPVIGRIKKDVVKRFGDTYGIFRSSVVSF